MKWFQHEISITAPSRGCHLITSQIQKTISQDLSQIKIGMCNLFIQHTSASLTVNENADPDVRRDMEVALNKIVPAEWNRDGTFRHTMEGDDDMPVSAVVGAKVVCFCEWMMMIVMCAMVIMAWQGVFGFRRCIHLNHSMYFSFLFL
jgi:secondary thiamine-phosphate synthase enzyme